MPATLANKVVTEHPRSTRPVRALGEIVLSTRDSPRDPPPTSIQHRAMQIFRRSNFPSLFADAPEKAPQDLYVRRWLKNETLPKKMTEPLARAVEKSLARKSATLDLRGLESAAIDRLPADLLSRLAAHTDKVLLDNDCPKDVRARIDGEFELAWLSRIPKSGHAPGDAQGTEPAKHQSVPSLPQSRDATDDETPHIRPIDGPDHGELARAGYPRHESVSIDGNELASPYDNGPPVAYSDSDGSITSRPAPTPHAHAAARLDVQRQRELIEQYSGSSPAARSETIQAGIAALRTPMAWLRGQAAMEGEDARCAISAADARALSAALNETSAAVLPRGEIKTINDARVVLARQVPNNLVTLSADEVKRLSRAMDAVRLLGARLDLPAPALPARVRSQGA